MLQGSGIIIKLLGYESLDAFKMNIVFFLATIFFFWAVFAVISDSVASFHLKEILISVRESQELSMQQKLISIYREIF